MVQPTQADRSDGVVLVDKIQQFPVLMKKPQLKTDDKLTKKPQDNSYKYPPGNQQYFPSYSSAQNLRPNIASKQSDSPNKNENIGRNSRKPEFLKVMAKNTPIGDERKSIRDQYYPTGNPREQNQQTFLRDSPHKLKIAKTKQLRETIKNDVSEYQKLHDKLNYLQNKISDLSSNIDKKRQEKWLFLENEKKERAKRFEKNQHGRHEASQKTQASITDSLKKFVTQVNEGKDYQPCNFNPYSPRHNIYYVSQILKFHKNDRSLAREHITMSAQYLKIFQSRKVPTEEEMSHRIVKLSKKTTHADKKTVVFDLDQTLIHCNDVLDAPHDVKIKIKFPTGEEIQAGINIRPHAVELLRALAKNFEVIVFTASHSCYANVVLDYLDPNNEFIHHRLYRQHCHITHDSVYVKDLRVINRDLSQMILVDNAAYSYAFQIDNAIPIIPYYKGKNDYQLKALQTYLEGMLFAKDVRDVNRKTFKLHKYKQFDDIDHLVKTLYGEFM